MQVRFLIIFFVGLQSYDFVLFLFYYWLIRVCHINHVHISLSRACCDYFLLMRHTYIHQTQTHTPAYIHHLFIYDLVSDEVVS